MQPAPIPQSEDGGLAEPTHDANLPTAGESEFDRITELAAGRRGAGNEYKFETLRTVAAKECAQVVRKARIQLNKSA